MSGEVDQAALASGQITPAQAKNMLLDPAQKLIKFLPLKDAENVVKKMTPEEQVEVEEIMKEKKARAEKKTAPKQAGPQIGVRQSRPKKGLKEVQLP